MRKAESIVGLIGARQGPWVYVGAYAAPRVLVHGAQEYVLVAELAHQPREDAIFATSTRGPESTGPLPPAQYMRLRLSTAAKDPICRIHSR